MDFPHPYYAGVYGRGTSWGAHYRDSGSNPEKNIWLGTYLTAEDAARAYDAGAYSVRGPNADRFNFPESPPSHIPWPHNFETEEIRFLAQDWTERHRLAGLQHEGEAADPSHPHVAEQQQEKEKEAAAPSHPHVAEQQQEKEKEAAAPSHPHVAEQQQEKEKEAENLEQQQGGDQKNA